MGWVMGRRGEKDKAVGDKEIGRTQNKMILEIRTRKTDT